MLRFPVCDVTPPSAPSAALPLGGRGLRQRERHLSVPAGGRATGSALVARQPAGSGGGGPRLSGLAGLPQLLGRPAPGRPVAAHLGAAQELPAGSGRAVPARRGPAGLRDGGAVPAPAQDVDGPQQSQGGASPRGPVFHVFATFQFWFLFFKMSFLEIENVCRQ